MDFDELEENPPPKPRTRRYSSMSQVMELRRLCIEEHVWPGCEQDPDFTQRGEWVRSAELLSGTKDRPVLMYSLILCSQEISLSSVYVFGTRSKTKPFAT